MASSQSSIATIPRPYTPGIQISTGPVMDMDTTAIFIWTDHGLLDKAVKLVWDGHFNERTNGFARSEHIFPGIPKYPGYLGGI